jgi:methylmalonyl-CoA decarboxylase subunit alpha
MKRDRAMDFEKVTQEFANRQGKSLEMCGTAKVAQQHGRGKWKARERIDRLLDPESFLEVGRLNHSDIPGMEEKNPCRQQNLRIRRHRRPPGCCDGQ